MKNKINSDLGFDFSGCCNTLEEGKVTSALETKYDMSSYGFQTGVKWTTENELETEVTIADSAIINGLKLAFCTKSTMGGDKKSGTIKAMFDGGNYNMAADVAYEGEPKVNSSGVFK